MLVGVSLDGKQFFYSSPLVVKRGETEEISNFHGHRSAWFTCSCCPPNIARLIASVAGYLYSTDRNSIWVHLYAGGSAEVDLADQSVRLTQKTKYPWDGKVAITVRPEREAEFTLALRIPGWCRKPSLKVNGKSFSLKAVTRKGYAHVKRRWSKGDRVELLLPMPVELIEAHPNARQDAGKVAIQRGPVVYCLEEVDNFKNLHDVVLPGNAKFTATFQPKLLGGVTVLTARATKRETTGWAGTLYPANSSKHKSETSKANR
jgi:hypothetical protein